MTYPPERIVCLTEETVETLYLLGEEARIVGVSGYAVRPARVRKEKPRVSAFISADVPKILALEPDLVFTFSDLQADIVASLIREGIPVHAFNQRSVSGILDMIRMVGAIVGKAEEATRLATQLSGSIDAIRCDAQGLDKRPRIYFEEWDEPMISGIGWVSEIVEAAGGVDIFLERAKAKSAKGRIVTADEVIAAAPDIILGSWCGKRFRPERVCARPGFEKVPAVRYGALYEIKSPIILQPGPAALTDGIRAVADIIRNWAMKDH
jgi:iron complex transport system substrate-binding protein